MQDLRQADGSTVRLRDYGGAGQNRRPYQTWLRAMNAEVTPFSRAAPLRISNLKSQI
jgi:hypothetical protein